MSNGKQTNKNREQPRIKKREAAILLLGVFTVSFAVLTLETSLMRMFSVMFAYHYAFLAVAIAFAGLGLGGIVGHSILREKLQERPFARAQTPILAMLANNSRTNYLRDLKSDTTLKINT